MAVTFDRPALRRAFEEHLASLLEPWQRELLQALLERAAEKRRRDHAGWPKRDAAAPSEEC